MRIDFLAGARCFHLQLGTEARANLAYVRVGIRHVLHAPSYIDYLHESFHLVLNAVVHSKGRDDAIAHVFAGPEDDRLLKDRLAEAFAFLMCRLFVFGTDPSPQTELGACRQAQKAFVQSHLAAFGRSSSISDGQVPFTLIQTSELLLRLFIAFESWDETDEPIAVPVRERFVKFLDFASPMLRDRGELWSGIDSIGGRYCWTVVQNAYSEIGTYIPLLRREAFMIYHKFYNTLGDLRDYDNLIYQEIGNAIANGQPLSGILVQNGDELDPLVLSCRILQFHLSKITNTEQNSLHVRRDSRTLKADFELPSGQRWHEFLIDIGAPAMFCPVPSERRNRLRCHIAMLKSFWNVAAELRSRRMHTVLKENWGDSV